MPVPATHSALSTALTWLEQLLLGQMATMIAILAIGFASFAMLQGRLEVRTSLRIILGCFILFGAPAIAQGLVAMAGTPSGGVTFLAPAADYHGNVVPPAFDPYAGASTPQ